MHRLLACLLCAPPLLAAHRDPLAYVNPLIGTQKSKIGYGGTMPFVSPPFAMTNWTPQTRQNKISITSYEYDDAAITGFIGTHQPAIWMGDYGYITLMPQVGELRTTPEARRRAHSRRDDGHGALRISSLPFSERRRRARARRNLAAGRPRLCRR